MLLGKLALLRETDPSAMLVHKGPLDTWGFLGSVMTACERLLLNDKTWDSWPPEETN